MSNHKLRSISDAQQTSGQTTSSVTALRRQLNAALMIGALVFLASLFGILTRPTANLAAFWPANAILLGLFVRTPRFATSAGWISAMVFFVAAGLFTGDSFFKAIGLSAVNMISVAAGYLMYRRYDETIRSLKRSRSILIMLGNVFVAAAAAGMAGAVIHPFLFDGTALHGWSFWFTTEVVNYMAILPVIFSAPSMSWRWLERRRHITLPIDLRRLIPVAAVLLSCAMSILIGGPGAVAFPVPALLWCSVTYSVFTTSLLTLGFSVWTLIAISTNAVNFSIAGNAIDAEMSIRIGVTLITLAPITLAVVMEARNELMRRLLDIASRDQLTGLLNRHAFRERCNTVLRELGLGRKPASLLMIDIDHFKSVNDTHGQIVGDHALNRFSAIASTCLRSSDIFGRLGGEEFAVLLPDCAHSNTQMVAERIRRTIAETPIHLDNGQPLSITVSIGAAFTYAVPDDLDPLLLVADSALYRAKKTGRNKVIESELQSGRSATTAASSS